jgi:peptide deformylase
LAILKVAQLGHPVLRQKAEPVPKDMLGRPGLEKLVEDMVDTLREYEGLGLAAPQVHYPVQIIIVESRGDKAGQEEIPLTVLLNPQIVESSEEEVSNWEGCLSLGDLRGIVPRARSVVVEALDRKGQPLTLKAQDFFARVLQHEIDHLNATLFIDRMPDLRYLAFNREFARYWVPPQPEEGEAGD